MNFSDLGKVVSSRSSLLLGIIALALVGSGGMLLIYQLDREPPSVRIDFPTGYIGSRPLQIAVTDRGKGLRSVSVSLIRPGDERSLFREEYDGVSSKTVTISVSDIKPAVEEGEAVLRVRAIDGSYWNFFKGNETVVERKAVVDLTKPKLEILKGDRRITLGGSGLVIYRTSPDTAKSGVKIGNYFFRGYKYSRKDIWLAFFGHPYDVGLDEKADLLAEDHAGNGIDVPLSYVLKPKQYRKTKVLVTDAFIEEEIAPLLGEKRSAQDSLREVFLKVNSQLRRQTESRIRQICRQSVGELLWDGAFHQLSNSQVQATFALERTYEYRGETIDRAYHLGYDLAVTKNYPVEAANSGIVVFAGELGIYGNAVILDHGFGLFTLYGHMSSISVTKGEKVEKRAIIGKTGQTGLATGDHLHFATLIHGTPVLPLEWWDNSWVRVNVSEKLKSIAPVA
jgi:murein DD-endopeptidase MepM/ murein hydrolase activator NlpD